MKAICRWYAEYVDQQNKYSFSALSLIFPATYQLSFVFRIYFITKQNSYMFWGLYVNKGAFLRTKIQ